MQKVTFFLTKAAYVIAGIFLSYIFYNAIHYTYHFDPEDIFTKYVQAGPDSRLKNIAFILVFFFFFIILSKFLFFKSSSKEAKQKRVFIFATVMSVLVFVLCALFARYLKLLPWYDQETVFEIAENFKNKDYFADSTQWLYLKMYPQEFGLVFFEVLLLKIIDSYMFFEYLNAFFIGGIVFFSFLICKEISDSPLAEFVTTILVSVFIPLYYYTFYIYGDIFSIFSIAVVSLLGIRWLKTKKFPYIISAIVWSCIMVPVRKNALIFLISLCILFIISGLKDKNYPAFLFAFLFLVLPLLSSKGTRFYFEKAADYKIDNEIPAINWVVMGLRGDPYENKGVGFFDGYIYWNWNLLNQDKAATTEIAKEHLSEIGALHKSNPRYAYDFVRYKILEQWTEPSFACYYMTSPTLGVDYGREIRYYSNERVKRNNNLMNVHQTLVYFFSLMFLIYLIFTKRKDCYSLILYVTFIGGFLFSLIWEASGRYVLPYYVVLIPAAGMGVAKTAELLKLFRSILNGKSNQELDSNS